MENLDQLQYRPPRCVSGWQAAHLASRRHHSLAKARPCPRTSSAEKKAPSRAGATSVLITAHLGSRLPTIRRSVARERFRMLAALMRRGWSVVRG